MLSFLCKKRYANASALQQGAPDSAPPLQMRAVLSSDDVRMTSSLRNCTELTRLEWPFRVASWRAADRSNSLTMVSLPAVATTEGFEGW